MFQRNYSIDDFDIAQSLVLVKVFSSIRCYFKTMLTYMCKVIILIEKKNYSSPRLLRPRNGQTVMRLLTGVATTRRWNGDGTGEDRPCPRGR